MAGWTGMRAVPITAFHNADPRLMADWATVEHATGVEPPAPPPAIDVAELLRQGTQETAGVSRQGSTAYMIDQFPATPAVQLQGRVSAAAAVQQLCAAPPSLLPPPPPPPRIR